MGCHFLLQGIFPTQGLNPALLHCSRILYCQSHPEREMGQLLGQAEEGLATHSPPSPLLSRRSERACCAHREDGGRSAHPSQQLQHPRRPEPRHGHMQTVNPGLRLL